MDGYEKCNNSHSKNVISPLARVEVINSWNSWRVFDRDHKVLNNVLHAFFGLFFPVASFKRGAVCYFS